MSGTKKIVFYILNINKMEQYRYWIEGWKECRYNLAIEQCSRCLFENLCLFEQNQERIWKDIATQGKTS